MMKVPSLSPAAAGDFLIHHGEKFVVSLIGMVALLMTWWGFYAVQSQTVDATRTPSAITRLAEQAAVTISRSSSPPEGRIPEVRPLGPRVAPWRPEQVKLAEPPARPFWLDRGTASELTKRTTPDIFPITDLRAAAGVAVLFDADVEARAATLPPSQISPLAPGLPPEKPINPGRITPFVVVTGVIPAGKQKAEYERSFSGASFRDAARDTPRWALYVVERSRVVAGAAPRWERLKIVNVTTMGAAGAPPTGPEAPSLTPEMLPPSFFLGPEEAEVGYAAALPQRVDGPWGVESIHPWFEPKIKERQAATVVVQREPESIVEATLADLAAKPRNFRDKEVALNGVLLDPGSKRQSRIGLHRFGVRTVDGKTSIEPTNPIGSQQDIVFAASVDLGQKLAFDLDLDKGKPRSCNLLVRVDMMNKTPVARLLEIAFLDEAGDVDEIRRESSPEPVVLQAEGGDAPTLAQQAPTEPPLENRLFRFVDLDVEPGVEYRYRVRFALRNPNAGLAIQHVANVAITKGDFLLAEYSPETSPVRVPDPTQVIARTMPRDAARRLKVRGDTVEILVLAPSETGNYAMRSVVTTPGGSANVDPSLNKPADMRNFGQPATTGRILLDFRGAQEEKFDARNPLPQEPLEMLFLRPDGEFEVVTAADSELLVRKYRSTLFVPGTDLPDDGKPPKVPAADPRTPRSGSEL